MNNKNSSIAALRLLAFIYFTIAKADGQTTDAESSRIGDYLKKEVESLNSEGDIIELVEARIEKIVGDARLRVDAMAEEERIVYIENHFHAIFGGYPWEKQTAMINNVMTLSLSDGSFVKAEKTLARRLTAVVNKSRTG